jgi:hypothetical protein
MSFLSHRPARRTFIFTSPHRQTSALFRLPRFLSPIYSSANPPKCPTDTPLHEGAQNPTTFPSASVRASTRRVLSCLSRPNAGDQPNVTREGGRPFPAIRPPAHDRSDG